MKEIILTTLSGGVVFGGSILIEKYADIFTTVIYVLVFLSFSFILGMLMGK